MKAPLLKSLWFRNFKAIRDSKSLKLSPLTVLIGNNGSGKSSVLEGLETVQRCVEENIDAALQMWRGIEHVRNKARKGRVKPGAAGELRSTKPIVFMFKGRLIEGSFSAATAWNEHGAENELFFEGETVRMGGMVRLREGNRVRTQFRPGAEVKDGRPMLLPAGKSLLNVDLGDYIKRWQFLSLWPQAMGNPTPQIRSKGPIRLAKDGSNIAEYLRSIRDLDRAAFDGIVDALRAVLPYAEDVQPAVTSELERTVYLQLSERDFKVPGWLLSTGTLRILAILALLRHPEPPPLVAIEEIENGLDPRTVHLLVEEIRAVLEAGRTQLLITTHSPYLLDLLPLSTIVLVDRVEGEPRFTRPADSEQVRMWAKNFAPGDFIPWGNFAAGAHGEEADQGRHCLRVWAGRRRGRCLSRAGPSLRAEC